MVWSKMKIREAPVLPSSQSASSEAQDQRDERVFEQLLGLWVVVCLDLRIVEEILLRAPVTVDLESILVKCIVLLFASDIMHRHIKRLNRPFISLGLSGIGWVRSTPITWVFVVVQVRVDMVLLLLRC